jgi:hypothetical protein
VYSPVLASVLAARHDASGLGDIGVQYLPYSGYFKLSTLTLTLTFVSKDTL